MVFFSAALKKGNTLQQLYVCNNNITDEVCNMIATLLKENTSLIKLWIDGNKISALFAQHLVEALHHNNTLQEISLPRYSADAKEIIACLQQEVIKNRESREVKLN